MNWRFVPSWTCQRQLYSLQDSPYSPENTLAIVTSLFPAVQVKKIDIRMLLPFVMLHWFLLFPISLGRSIIDYLLKQSGTSHRHIYTPTETRFLPFNLLYSTFNLLHFNNFKLPISSLPINLKYGPVHEQRIK